MLLGMEFWGSNFQTHQTKALRLSLVACCLHVSLRPQEGLFGQQELAVIFCWNLSSTTKYGETSEHPWKHLKTNHFRYQFCLGFVVSWLNCTKDHESRIAPAYCSPLSWLNQPCHRQNAPGPGAYEQRSSLGKTKMLTARGLGAPSNTQHPGGWGGQCNESTDMLSGFQMWLSMVNPKSSEFSSCSFIFYMKQH